MPKTWAVIAAGIVLALGYCYVKRQRAAAGVTDSSVGAAWLFGSGTPDQVKSNKATLPITANDQWKNALDALDASKPTPYEVANLAPAANPQGWVVS